VINTPYNLHRSHTDLQEATTHHDGALAVIRPITDALNLMPPLCNEVRDLRQGLAIAVADLADLVAAGKATLGAYADGEQDPLYYLRDELEAQGHIHRDTNRTRSQEWL
jgi:hypothetical protein